MDKMRKISLFLLGSPRVEIEEQEVTFSRRKVLALLIYLAVTSQTHNRETLAELLYADSTRDTTKSNLRRTLSTLNGILGSDVLAIDRQTIGFADKAQVWVDVEEFRSYVNQARCGIRDARAADLRSVLERAIELYRGDFAEGFYLKHSVAFDAWQLEVQQSLSNDMLFALRNYAVLLEEDRAFDEAIRCSRHILRIDPFDEVTHRRLMMLHGRMHNLSAAMRQYQECLSALEELGAEPEEETLRLLDDLRSGHRRGMRDNSLRVFPAVGRLPSRPTSFIGRKTELRAISQRLRDGTARMISLTGPGGIGKTRLAIQAAELAADGFPDGICFVDLSTIRDSTHLLSSIAGALQLREQTGLPDSLCDFLSAYLMNMRLLLVLDNFEHIMPAAGDVAELLHRTSSPKLLVTSRERLHLEVEEEFVVPPLSIPSSGRSAGKLNEYEAVRLFVERARTAHPALSIERESLSAIAEICVRLDGLPLAIELAVSRLSVLSPHELLQRIGNRISLLKGNVRDVPERQQTMRAELDWSFRLLTPFEKQVFVRLSVFVNGCDLEAAQAMCAPEERTGYTRVVDCLQSLIDKSLLQHHTELGESRYRMLEIMHEYALSILQGSEDRELIQRLHANYYLDWIENAAERLHGPNQIYWLARVELELSNLNQAIMWFFSNGEIAKCLRFGLSLEWAWYRLGRISIGREWLERILSAIEDHRVHRLQGRVLRALGWTRFVQGDWPCARSLYEKSVALCREQRDREGMGVALSYLAVAERWLGEHELGTHHAEKAVSIARESGDRLRLRTALIWAYATTGGKRVSDRQQNGLEEAIHLSREAGDEWSLAHALNGVGDLLRESGETEAACRIYEQALTEFKKLGDRWLTAWTLEGLGRARYAGGKSNLAKQCILESIRLFLETGDRENALMMLDVLLAILQSCGEHRRAACLAGAINSLRRSNTTESVTRSELGPDGAVTIYEEAYADEWYRGQSMTLEGIAQELLTYSTNSDDSR
jgi:predicted ATPase/DNA-binding SARP family transcriptional activator